MDDGKLATPRLLTKLTPSSLQPTRRGKMAQEKQTFAKSDFKQLTFWGLTTAVLIGESWNVIKLRNHILLIQFSTQQSIVAWEYTLRLFSISMAMMALTDTIWYVAKSKWSNMCGPPERQPLTRVHKQAIYFCAIFYNTTLGMVKLSVLSLYRRILAGIPSRTLPIINWTAFGIVSVNTTINVCVAAFQCRPIAAAFDNSVKGKCINQAAFYLGNASTGIFTDVMVYGLSIPIVKPLQMDPKKKLQTLLTLLMGGL